MTIRSYLFSLPERVIRSTLGLGAGAVREVGEVALPPAIRRSQLYQNLVDATLRYVIEEIGGVESVYRTQEALPDNFLARRTAGNAVEVLGIIAFHASPVWVLAALADLCGAGRHLIPEMADALKAQGLLEQDTQFTSVDQLLNGLERTSSRLAATINTPPLDVAGLRKEWEAIRDDARGLQPASLPSQETVSQMWEQLKVESVRQDRTVFETSSMMAVAAARSFPGGARWLFASARVGAGRTGQIAAMVLLEHYGDTLREMRKTGYLAFAARQFRPYLRAAVQQFAPKRRTLTQRMLEKIQARRSALLLLTLVCGCSRPPAIAQTDAASSPDVVELSAVEARDRMSAGTLTSRALTQAYLDRIALVDDAGPRLNAVIEISSQAVADAEALDAERRAGRVRGPLHGIPVLIKDNIDSVGMVNSAGSLALAENRPKQDAFIVSRLRAAGAVILGKTNLSEWANFRSTRSTSGWSSRGGQTKHAYVLDRNPCGSSSGTATAIAASLAAIGVGTETDGSIICPAAVSGLVGLKPTVGLVSRRGIIPLSVSQDTAGPMGRSVADVALLMNALAGVDAADPAAPAAGAKIPADYTVFLDADALTGKRLGVLRQAMGEHPAVDAALETAIATMKARGAEIVDVKLAAYNGWEDSELDMLLYEFKDGLNTYLKASGSPMTSLEALISWNKANADKVMPFFGQELFERAQAKGPPTDAAYRKARDDARRIAGKEGLIAALDRGNLDALIAPSMTPAWLTDHLLGDHFAGGTGYSVASVAGTPSITVPVGEAFNLPLGLTFMGRAYSEPELIGFAYSLEQIAKARKPPQYKPTLGDEHDK